MQPGKIWLWASLIIGLAVSALAQSTINTTNKWACSTSAGWINCRTDSTNGAVIGQYYCSGFWYSPTAGWIALGNGSPSNGIHYATNSMTDYGVNHDSEGHLSGYAWCPSSGWINFGWTNNVDSPNAPKVDLVSGALSGYAWGGGLGWISLTNLSAYLKTDLISAGADSDSNGIPDAWELQAWDTNAVGSIPATNVYNGFTYYQAYIADASPTNPNSYPEVGSVSLSGTNMLIAWNSAKARLYYIQKKNSLFDLNWLDSGFGLISADSDSNTVRLLPVSTQGFYRIKVVLPALVQ